MKQTKSNSIIGPFEGLKLELVLALLSNLLIKSEITGRFVKNLGWFGEETIFLGSFEQDIVILIFLMRNSYIKVNLRLL